MAKRIILASGILMTSATCLGTIGLSGPALGHGMPCFLAITACGTVLATACAFVTSRMAAVAGADWA